MHFFSVDFIQQSLCLYVCVWMNTLTACFLFYIRSQRLRIVMRLINGADNTKTYLDQTIRGN